jgi:hypothetical protein
MGGASTLVLPEVPLGDCSGLRMASAAEFGEKVMAFEKSSTESRSARGQNPVFKTLSERAMHSTMSPER